MMIIFDQVSKKYGNGTVALDNVSFSLDEGEFVIVEGHSGAGKTTLQKLLIKEIAPDSGTVKVDGDDVHKISKKNIPLLRRKIGIIFQDFKIIFDKTVAENILLALDIMGIAEDVAATRLTELLELTGLTGKEDTFPIQLSGGELQRVAIARAVAGDPRVIFADEPTGNLDEATGTQIIELLKTINKQGTTIMVATHDHHLVKSHGLRTLHFDKGVLTHETNTKKKL